MAGAKEREGAGPPAVPKSPPSRSAQPRPRPASAYACALAARDAPASLTWRRARVIRLRARRGAPGNCRGGGVFVRQVAEVVGDGQLLLDHVERRSPIFAGPSKGTLTSSDDPRAAGTALEDVRGRGRASSPRTGHAQCVKAHAAIAALRHPDDVVLGRSPTEADGVPARANGRRCPVVHTHIVGKMSTFPCSLLASSLVSSGTWRDDVKGTSVDSRKTSRAWPSRPLPQRLAVIRGHRDERLLFQALVAGGVRSWPMIPSVRWIVPVVALAQELRKRARRILRPVDLGL